MIGALVLLASVFGSSVGWAGPCETDTTGIATGPVTVGFQDGDLGVPRRVCARSEVGLAPGGLAVVDTANFYGHIVAGGTLEGSWAPSRRTEVYASVEAFRYDSVITPIPATYMGFGHVGIGASQRLWDNEAVAIGLHGRVVAPTAVGLYRNAYPIGLDIGVSGLWAPLPTLRVHADVAGLGSAAISHGPSLPRAGARVMVGGEWQPVKPFALVLDVTSGFGYTAPVDSVAASLGLRFGIGDRVGIELGASVPLAGRERTLAAGELKFNVRLGKLEGHVLPPEPVVAPS
ncbi:MAG: hypothetical protein Q8P18_13400 [Pseudomonadota bacterium]|nr:hypothetical protein [Pseudomonadota bacterium]